MTIPFYKLQLAGNGFILIDLADRNKPEGLTPDTFAEISYRLCNRKYGIGGAGTIFLAGDNTIRIFTAQGKPATEADDALLCAARFAFDSGRITHKQIIFKTPGEEKTLEVLGSHEFRLSIGSPFSFPGGLIITPGSGSPVEILEHNGIRAAYAAVHIHENVLIAFPQTLGTLQFQDLSALIKKAFPDKHVIPVIARTITRETLLVRTKTERNSGVCASAAAALVAAICAGNADQAVVCMFEQRDSDNQLDNILAQDRDNSRRLAVNWDTAINELQVIGSGGYLFEGNFDIPSE